MSNTDLTICPKCGSSAKLITLWTGPYGVKDTVIICEVCGYEE